MLDTILYIVLMGVSTYVYTLNYRVLTPPLRALAINITLTFLIMLCAIYILKIEKKPNIYLFHILPIIQYGLYGYMFGQFFEQKLAKRLVWASVVLFTVVSLTLSFRVQFWSQYNSYAMSLYNVLLSIWSIYYLWRVFVDVKLMALEREASFWISTGLLFTSLGSFFVQGLMDYLLKSSLEYALAVYWIYELMNFVLFGIFLLALYVYLRYLPHTHRP